MRPGVYPLGSFWSLVFQTTQLLAELLVVAILFTGTALDSMVVAVWWLASAMLQLLFTLSTFHRQSLNLIVIIRNGFEKRRMRYSIWANFYLLKFAMRLIRYLRNCPGLDC
uniref:Uncharacterized protein n=1 Tax=Opuntia streptacantha TaxID=393608 RepID=A0A7C8ZXM6_OPUST